jgi:hypothetical protein
MESSSHFYYVNFSGQFHFHKIKKFRSKIESDFLKIFEIFKKTFVLRKEKKFRSKIEKNFSEFSRQLHSGVIFISNEKKI